VLGSIFNATVKSELRRNLPSGQRDGDVFSVIRTPEKVRALPSEVRRAVTEAIASGAGRVVVVAVMLTIVTFLAAWFLREEPLRTTTGREDVIPAE
jgi:hypothetical protein